MNKIEFTLRKKCGIYVIKNIINNKKYIGSSKNLYNRLHEHYHNLKFNKSHNGHLQNAWNKYGENNFIYEIIEFCDIDERFIKEQYYLDNKNPEYNFASKVIAFTGRIVSEEMKLRISNTLKRKYKNKEIEIQRRLDKSFPCYVYDIKNLKLITETDCLAKAIEATGSKHFGEYKTNKHRLIKDKFIITTIKFKFKYELINYINKNILCINSLYGKYLISEKQNGDIVYYRSKQLCAIDNNISASCIGIHYNATKNDPYFNKKNKSKIYFSNDFYEIKKEAVLIEKSLELLESNIGEKPEMENPEINN